MKLGTVLEWEYIIGYWRVQETGLNCEGGGIIATDASRFSLYLLYA